MGRLRSKMDNVRGFLLEGLNCITISHMTFYAQTVLGLFGLLLSHFVTTPFFTLQHVLSMRYSLREGRRGIRAREG